MKTLLALLLITTPAMAEQCYHAVEMPTATLTEAVDGLIWSDGKKSIHLDTTTGESGAVPRMAFNPENSNVYEFTYVDGKLIFNDDVYEPGCKINGIH